jgi:hypothetical protein
VHFFGLAELGIKPVFMTVEACDVSGRIISKVLENALAK